MPPPEAGAQPAAAVAPGRLVVALVVGQLGLHATMAGVRMAAALQALREGHTAWAVGVLLALFAAAPVLTAMHAGRMTDRRGYHPVVYAAVLLAMLGAGAAVGSTWAQGPWHLGLLCLAAMCTGTAANVGVLAIQRTAGASVRSDLERVRVFSWLGVAPPLANVIGPVAAGFMIDGFGFAAAYALMLVLPLATWATARRVPRLPPAGAAGGAGQGNALTLLRLPAMRRLLLVNWLLSSCWDVHAFAIPLLGHERGMSASNVGLILGIFTLAVTGVRMLIPLLAHRVTEAQVMRYAMLGTGAVFAAYPLAPNAWVMALLAALLGLSLGSVQPMLMSLLHQVTPEARHGEALAMRSMAMNATSTVMPLLFGASGAVVGAGVLFWAVGALVAAGAWLPRHIVGTRAD